MAPVTAVQRRRFAPIPGIATRSGSAGACGRPVPINGATRAAHRVSPDVLRFSSPRVNLNRSTEDGSAHPVATRRDFVPHLGRPHPRHRTTPIYDGGSCAFARRLPRYLHDPTQRTLLLAANRGCGTSRRNLVVIDRHPSSPRARRGHSPAFIANQLKVSRSRRGGRIPRSPCHHPPVLTLPPRAWLGEPDRLSTSPTRLRATVAELLAAEVAHANADLPAPRRSSARLCTRNCTRTGDHPPPHVPPRHRRPVSRTSSPRSKEHHRRPRRYADDPPPAEPGSSRQAARPGLGLHSLASSCS